MVLKLGKDFGSSSRRRDWGAGGDLVIELLGPIAEGNSVAISGEA